MNFGRVLLFFGSNHSIVIVRISENLHLNKFIPWLISIEVIESAFNRLNITLALAQEKYLR